jgi:hypothetical protein
MRSHHSPARAGFPMCLTDMTCQNASSGCRLDSNQPTWSDIGCCADLSHLAFESDSKILNLDGSPFWYCSPLRSIWIPSSVPLKQFEPMSRELPQFNCVKRSTFTFAVGSHISNLGDTFNRLIFREGLYTDITGYNRIRISKTQKNRVYRQFRLSLHQSSSDIAQIPL